MMYFGTSIGIAIRGDDLEAVCMRGRWKRVAVAGFLRIQNYRSRPVAEVAEQYRRFRKATHAMTTSAIVALPRESGLLRILELPAEIGQNLAAAIGYQVDTLHPFEEGGVYFDYAVLPAPGVPTPPTAETGISRSPVRVAVGLAEKPSVDELYDWCCRAGIDVAGFTFSTAAFYQALEKGAGLMVLDRQGGSTEILGLAADGGFCSRQCHADEALEREIGFCAAELRWSAQDEHPVLCVGEEGEGAAAMPPGVRLEPGLPAPLPAVAAGSPGGAAEFRLKESFTAYATALLGLERRLPLTPPKPGLRWNLLPAEKRIYRSHWAYTTAYAMAALIVLQAAAWVAIGWVQDRNYAAYLDRQISALKPRVQYADKLDADQKALLVKLETLKREQGDLGRKMGALQELTHLLPDSVWLNAMQISDVQVYFIGQAEAAAGLLQTLSQSAYFEQPQFQSAVSKNSEGKEVFQIRMRLRDVPLHTTALPPAAPDSGAPQPMATGAPRAGAGVAPGRPSDNAAMPHAAAPAKPNGAAAAKPTTPPKGDR
jgi:Tfp pilus assembly protein PilN